MIFLPFSALRPVRFPIEVEIDFKNATMEYEGTEEGKKFSYAPPVPPVA
jgi:hypothetical protein